MAVGAAALALLGAAAPDACSQLASLPIKGATVESATALPGGICRVSGFSLPSRGSHIGFEVRLPTPSEWSGRYYQIGNGGFAGHIDEATLADGATRGDAIAGTDTGHRGDGFDLSWAQGHPERLVDYAYRSIRTTSDAARAIVRAYYGRDADHRYAIGCSNGGRMALVAAARWPRDWDGVIAGAPANPWSVQLAAFRSLQSHLRASPDRWIPASKLPLIKGEALGGCPPGSVRDGVAQWPLACRTDWTRLKCRGRDRPDCLTGTQIGSLRAIARRGYIPSAMLPADWQQWILQADRSAHSQWSFAEQSAHFLPAKTEQAALLDIDPAMLNAFRDRGGRVVSYFGWSDAVISPMMGLAWYRRLSRQQNSGVRVQSWYRLFMVPGMPHCQGGAAPTSFGQSLDAPAMRDDRFHDIRRALEEWVEHGHVPETLIAHDIQKRNGGQISLRPQ